MCRALAVLLVLPVAWGCGARTDVDVPEPGTERRDGGTARFDAGPLDAGVDAGTPPADGGTDAGPVCPELRVSFAMVRPTVMLIIDRSGSMRALFRRWTPRYMSASRWEVIRGILVGEGDREGLLDLTAPRIRYGLATYTTSREVGCPDVRFVPPRLSNAGAIRDELYSTGPEGGTPTAEAIRDVTLALPELASGDEPVAYVLATDGEPNSCSGSSDPQADVVNAATEAFELGVRTYVISVGDDVSAEHLQDVANAGAGRGPGEGDAEFWIGNAPSSLQEALESAVGSATGCVGALSTPVADPSRACELTVLVDGEEVPCDDPDGFRLRDARHLELSGAACATVRTGEAALEVDAPCELLRP